MYMKVYAISNINKPRMLSHPFAIVIDVNIDREEQTVFWRQLTLIQFRWIFKIRYLENQAIF